MDEGAKVNEGTPEEARQIEE